MSVGGGGRKEARGRNKESRAGGTKKKRQTFWVWGKKEKGGKDEENVLMKTE